MLHALQFKSQYNVSDERAEIFSLTGATHLVRAHIPSIVPRAGIDSSPLDSCGITDERNLVAWKDERCSDAVHPVKKWIPHYLGSIGALFSRRMNSAVSGGDLESFLQPRSTAQQASIPTGIPTQPHETRCQRMRIAITSICFLAATATAATFYECSPRDSSSLHNLSTQESDRTPYDLAPLDVRQHLTNTLAPLLVYTAATSIIYHQNTHHQHQDYFVLSSICFGGFAGMVVYRDLQDAMLKVVPWTVLVGFATSMTVHGIWGAKKGIEGVV